MAGRTGGKLEAFEDIQMGQSAGTPFVTVYIVIELSTEVLV